MEPSTIEELLELQALTDAEEWRAVSDAAQVVASYLVCHPRVVGVRYPGIKSDPDFSRAANTLRGGFGPRVWYRLEGGESWMLYTATAGDPKLQVMSIESSLVSHGPASA